MTTVFTLTEKPKPDDFFQRAKVKSGRPWLIIERQLVDGSRNQVGLFTVRGTFMKKLPHQDAVVVQTLDPTSECWRSGADSVSGMVTSASW